jgi:hypothetical protein
MAVQCADVGKAAKFAENVPCSFPTYLTDDTGLPITLALTKATYVTKGLIHSIANRMEQSNFTTLD